MNETARQRVRLDLRWLLQAPPLLSGRALQWRPDRAFAPDLIERMPDATLTDLARLRGLRLGAYFEGLARALFQTSPDFTVLAHNRVIHDDGRTLGELDLLLLDHARNRVLHLELALKFYLRLQPPGSAGSGDRLWIGAGQRDFLAIKQQRLLGHQLRLPELAAQQRAWPVDLPKPDCSMAWVTGRVFHPVNGPATPTPAIAPGAMAGYWLTRSEFEGRPFAGQWVNKSGWLAPEPGTEEAPLKHPLPGQFLGSPAPDQPWRHWFVVPDDWPASARDRMLHRFQSRPGEPTCAN